MKIIRRGVRPDDQTLEGKCMRCNTVIHFAKWEGKYQTDRNESFWEHPCPVCGARICTSKLAPTTPTQET